MTISKRFTQGGKKVAIVVLLALFGFQQTAIVVHAAPESCPVTDFNGQQTSLIIEDIDLYPGETLTFYNDNTEVDGCQPLTPQPEFNFISINKDTDGDNSYDASETLGSTNVAYLGPGEITASAEGIYSYQLPAELATGTYYVMYSLTETGGYRLNQFTVSEEVTEEVVVATTAEFTSPTSYTVSPGAYMTTAITITYSDETTRSFSTDTASDIALYQGETKLTVGTDIIMNEDGTFIIAANEVGTYTVDLYTVTDEGETKVPDQTLTYTVINPTVGQISFSDEGTINIGDTVTFVTAYGSDENTVTNLTLDSAKISIYPVVDNVIGTEPTIAEVQPLDTNGTYQFTVSEPSFSTGTYGIKIHPTWNDTSTYLTLLPNENNSSTEYVLFTVEEAPEPFLYALSVDDTVQLGDNLTFFFYDIINGVEEPSTPAPAVTTVIIGVDKNGDNTIDEERTVSYELDEQTGIYSIFIPDNDAFYTYGTSYRIFVYPTEASDTNIQETFTIDNTVISGTITDTVTDNIVLRPISQTLNVILTTAFQYTANGELINSHPIQSAVETTDPTGTDLSTEVFSKNMATPGNYTLTISPSTTLGQHLFTLLYNETELSSTTLTIGAGSTTGLKESYTSEESLSFSTTIQTGENGETIIADLPAHASFRLYTLEIGAEEVIVAEDAPFTPTGENGAYTTSLENFTSGTYQIAMVDTQTGTILHTSDTFVVTATTDSEEENGGNNGGNNGNNEGNGGNNGGNNEGGDAGGNNGGGGGGAPIINHPPVAIIKPLELNPIVTGETLTVDGTQSFDPDNNTIFFSWNFGDGTSTELSTWDGVYTHTYTTSGVYTITLTVQDSNQAKATTSTEVTVVSLPTDEDPGSPTTTPSTGAPTTTPPTVPPTPPTTPVTPVITPTTPVFVPPITTPTNEAVDTNTEEEEVIPTTSPNTEQSETVTIAQTEEADEEIPDWLRWLFSSSVAVAAVWTGILANKYRKYIA